MPTFRGEFSDCGRVTDVDPVETTISYGLRFWSVNCGPRPSFVIASYHQLEMASQRLNIFTDEDDGFDPATLPAFIRLIKEAAKLYDYRYILTFKQSPSQTRRLTKLPRLPVVSQPLTQAALNDQATHFAKVISLPGIARPKIERDRSSVEAKPNNIIYPHPQLYPWGGRRVRTDAY